MGLGLVLKKKAFARQAELRVGGSGARSMARLKGDENETTMAAAGEGGGGGGDLANFKWWIGLTVVGVGAHRVR